DPTEWPNGAKLVRCEEIRLFCLRVAPALLFPSGRTDRSRCRPSCQYVEQSPRVTANRRPTFWTVARARRRTGSRSSFGDAPAANIRAVLALRAIRLPW